MPRAALSPSPVCDTLQTSAHVLQFFGRGWMGVEKAGISQMSQCLKDHQPPSIPVPFPSDNIKSPSPEHQFFVAFPW